MRLALTAMRKNAITAEIALKEILVAGEDDEVELAEEEETRGIFTELLVAADVVPSELELVVRAKEEEEEIVALTVVEAIEVVTEELAAPEVEKPITLLKPGSATHRVPEGSNAIPSGVHKSD
jgi:hypothetical protein